VFLYIGRPYGDELSRCRDSDPFLVEIERHDVKIWGVVDDGAIDAFDKKIAARRKTRPNLD